MIYCYSFQLDKTAKIWTSASPACISQGSRSLIFCFAGKPWGKTPTVCLANDFTEKDYCMQTVYWSQPEVRLSCYFTGEHDTMFSWLKVFWLRRSFLPLRMAKQKLRASLPQLVKGKPIIISFSLFSCLGFQITDTFSCLLVVISSCPHKLL